MSLLDARLYAATHRGNAGDAAYYAELCRGAQSVLELGSGSGRLLSALAAPGRSLVGLELDPELLRLGRAARAALPAATRAGVRLVHGDMRQIALGRRFERVLLPYNALYCLLDERDVSRCFRAVFRALEPGGLFAFDVWSADHLFSGEWLPSDDSRPLAEFEEAKRLWRVFERCRLGRSPGRLDVSYTYETQGRAARTQLVRQRYYASSRLVALLEQCGFRIVQKHGNFSGARFGSRSQRLVLVARAPGSDGTRRGRG